MRLDVIEVQKWLDVYLETKNIKDLVKASNILYNLTIERLENAIKT